MELPIQHLKPSWCGNFLNTTVFWLLMLLIVPPLYAQALIYDLEAKEWRRASDPNGPAYGMGLDGRFRPVDEIQREMEAACKKKGTFEQYYQECIIDKMQGVRSAVAYSESLAYCTRKAPCAWITSKRGGILGVNSANKCFEKYGAPTRFEAAAYEIRNACYELYEDK